MPTENTMNSNTGLFDELREGVNSFIDKIESDQSKVNKAMFEALSKEQRTIFLNSLDKQGVKPKKMEKITGKSQSTVSRALSGK